MEESRTGSDRRRLTHRIGLAPIVVMMMLAAILHRHSAAVGALGGVAFAPYAAWVAFAAVLNGSIWMLN